MQRTSDCTLILRTDQLGLQQQNRVREDDETVNGLEFLRFLVDRADTTLGCLSALHPCLFG